MKRIAWAALCLAASTCLADPLKILPLDIFKNDSTTRQAAPKNDVRWTVYTGGCTGSMLSTRYLLTANHCTVRTGDTFTSGGCYELGCRGDLKVVKVAEKNATYDSQIVEVTWSRKDSRWRQRYTPKIQTKDSDVMVGKDGQATELFTVGFPGDKSGPMHAIGYAKSRTSSHLQYNVASINGNSGGAVWKSEDFMLVSQTNHGPHALNQPGWNNNDPEDSSSWNGGPRMNLLYNASSLLQELFPDGLNPNVSFEGYLIYDDTLPPLDP